MKKWRGEHADVYLAELKGLAGLAGIESVGLLRQAFVVGMPDKISRELRAQANIENLNLNEIVGKCRVLIDEYNAGVGAVAVRV